MGRVAAIDYGRRRIGIAVSDTHQIIASPHPILEGNLNAVVTFLKTVSNLEKIVIGLPLMMNGTEGEMCVEVRAFAAKLEAQLSLPIQLWDERLSSRQVESLLSQAGFSARAMKERTDSLAAAVILQSYLDSQSLKT